MDSCETARYSLFRSQPNRVQFARLRAAPSILHINGTPGTGRLLSPEYNDQNINEWRPAMFKLSLQLQKAAQHLCGTTLNVTAVLATLVLQVVPRALAATTATNSCQLKSPKGAIQHVIYVQFDNTHFRRDNPDVPSDLEQMPHLLNFIQDNGVLMSNDHTVLISHTATGILTSLTGVYPDRMGQPVSNSFRYFKTDGTTRTGVSFAYWTAPLFDPAGSTTDTTPEMINENGKIAPAPWVPFTRAGCDFGAVATANTILENTAIDIPTVFGAGSPEAQEVTTNPGQAFADFVGIGIHCAQGSAKCAAANIHFADGRAEAGYVQQLRAYDRAFQKFFARLAADGINKSNTLFVFTVDEGDHFVGDAPTPAGCDGVTTPCTYNRVGEINADLRRMVYTQFGDSTLFSVHSDDAPTVYVNGTSANLFATRLIPSSATLSGR